jgi:asparagine synthetase B (glutamine-hydrolysing)
MCGIFGDFSFDMANWEFIQAMAEHIAHRGPDG